MRILGIETSCDDTAVALLDVEKGSFRVKKNYTASQEQLHKKYGGVVPEVAARAHTETMVPLLREALGSSPKHIEVIAVTKGPGLITSLHVGVETAKALSWAWNIPLVAVNHIEGHLCSVLLGRSSRAIRFPAMALIVSGGHTELILMRDYGRYSLIGRTRDDAAGETFDKSAKMLGLPYPGGPEISKRGENGDPKKFKLPRPMLDQDNLEFSFSGLKNAIRLLVQDLRQNKKRVPINDMCASIEHTIVDILTTRSIQAAAAHKPKTFILAGGVAANKTLRQTLQNSLPKNITFLMPEMQYCQDNAAMIAAAAYEHAKKKQFISYQRLVAHANEELVY